MEARKAALILMKNSHFDMTLQYTERVYERGQFKSFWDLVLRYFWLGRIEAGIMI